MNLVGLAVALALMALPPRVSAQQSNGSGLQYDLWQTDQAKSKPAPTPQPPSEKPALELKLDDAGVEVTPTPPRKAELTVLERRAKRAKIGIGASASSLVVGGIMAGASVPYLTCTSDGLGRGDCPNPGWAVPVFVTGLTLAGGGVLGMIATGTLLGVRKRKIRNLGQAHDARPRHVQWDLARSRLVF